MTGHWTVRVYRLLLRLLPRERRRQIGDDAAELFGWQRARVPAGAGRSRFIAGAWADVVREAASARLRALAGGAGAGRPSRGAAIVTHELRTALRNARRRPGLTVSVVATLGLGIGLATAMAAVVHVVLLEPLPYPDGDRLVVVRERTDAGALLRASMLNFADWREGGSSFDGLAAVTGPLDLTVLGAAEPVRARVLFVTADYFRVAGVGPAVGRTLRTDENAPGGPPAVVVGHGFWARVLEGRADPATAQLVLRDLHGVVGSYTVVGVMPPGFDLMGAADVYMPLDRAIPWNVRGNHVVDVIGRLRPAATPAIAAEELDQLQRRIVAGGGDTEAVGVGVARLRDDVVAGIRTPVLLLLGGALLLLFSAFLDTAGVLLARGVARREELLVRVSLGATRARLLVQLILESGLYAFGGLVAGLGIARGLLAVLARLAPPTLPHLGALQPAWLGLAGAAAVLAGSGLLLFGIATAILTLRSGTAPLRVRGGGDGPGARRVWGALIATQVALALMLSSTAVLLGRSLWGILSADTGFDSTGVVTADVNLQSGADADVVRWFDTALAELRALPGVDAVGLSNLLPVQGGGGVAGPVRLETGESPDLVAQYRVADGGFFDALGIPLVSGRTFDATDGPGAPHAVVINTTLADRLWPGVDPLGHRFHAGGMDSYRDDWLTVVGVVAEARPWSVAGGTYPVYYVSYRQRPLFLTLTGADLVVRGGTVAALSPAIRDKLTAIDRDVPVRIRTLDERLASRTADRRFVLALLGVFAALALVLTAIGIGGVVSFIANRRRRDMGLRMVLGARPAQVLRALQRETLPAVAVGMAAGALLSGALIRLVRSQLYGVGVFDPVSLAAVALAIAVTAWGASYFPARRVKRLDPAVTLRDP